MTSVNKLPASDQVVAIETVASRRSNVTDVSVDLDLVERAVSDLNAIYTSKALQTACLIGEYVIDHFFAGNLSELQCKGQQQPSFRALAKRKDLRFSATYLWTAVAVVGQLRQLPGDLGWQLPLSHHRLLLPLQDANLRERLAKKAIDKGLSKRDLAREIAQLSGKPATRQSKRGQSPTVIEALSHLVEASEEFVRAAVSENNGIEQGPSPGAKAMLKRLEIDLDAVLCAVGMMRSRLSLSSSQSSRVSPGKRHSSKVTPFRKRSLDH